MGDRRIQFNNWISENDIIEFKKIIAKKYGIYLNNMQSHEVGLLIKWYNSVGGNLPDTSRSHTSSTENTISSSHPGKKVKVELLATVGSRTRQQEEEQEQPQADTMEESVLLRNWLMTKCIDITDMNRFNRSVTDEDLHNAHKLRTDLEYQKRWRKDCITKLEAKNRRISYNNMQAKLKEQDNREIAPVMREIKQYLQTTYDICIGDRDRVDRDQIYEAFKVVTGYGDQRTFIKALVLYVMHEYLKPLNEKKTSFRLMDKFKEL
jgi:hypothetical protein